MKTRRNLLQSLACLPLLPSISHAALSDENSPAPSGVTSTARRALIIGNSAYPTTPLENATTDAAAIKEALAKLGFQATLLQDVDKATLETNLQEFLKSPAGLKVVCYSGNGFEMKGETVLLPIGKLPDSLDTAKQGTVPITFGLPKKSDDLSIAKLYSCQPGQVCADGPGKHSPFAAALLKALETPGQGLSALTAAINKNVNQSEFKQRATLEMDCQEDVILHPPQQKASSTSPTVLYIVDSCRENPFAVVR